MSSLEKSSIKLCFARIVPASYLSDRYVVTFKISGYEMKSNDFHKYFINARTGSFGGTHKDVFHDSFPIEDYDKKMNEIYDKAKSLGFKTEKSYDFFELQNLSKSLRKKVQPK